MVFIRNILVVLFLIIGTLFLIPNIVLAQQCGDAQTQWVVGCNDDYPTCSANINIGEYDCFPNEGTCWGMVNGWWCEKRPATQSCLLHQDPDVLIPCGSGGGGGSGFSIDGNVDGYTCNPRKINGWAVGLQDNVGRNNPLWINALQWPLVAPAWTPASPHQLTDILRSDINTIYSITGNHGFNLDFPAEWVDVSPAT
jgi:hypothetical protein